MVLYGGCQSCGSAADSFGSSIAITGQWRGSQLEFTIAGCRHNATVPTGDVSEVSGTVTCAFEARTEGTWRMKRKP
jgi:hypothetical protein